MTVTWAQQVDELATSTLLLARSRAGRIAAVTVAVPEGFAWSEMANRLRERLAACGYPGLEVMIQTAAGPPRILSAEFER